MFNVVTSPLPKKTYMRRSLTMHNPPVIKSGTDGRIYRRNGRVLDMDYPKPKGRVYVAPKDAGVTGYDVLKPFGQIMNNKLRQKGLVPPSSIEDTSKLFYNQIIAAKGFDGNKPMNFEAYDNADATVKDNVLNSVLTYFKSLNTGVQPNGQPLSTQDKAISVDVKNVIQDLAAKVSAAGLSPQDAAAAGAAMSNAHPNPEPFYSKPVFKWAAIAAAVIILIVIITR